MQRDQSGRIAKLALKLLKDVTASVMHISAWAINDNIYKPITKHVFDVDELALYDAYRTPYSELIIAGADALRIGRKNYKLSEKNVAHVKDIVSTIGPMFPDLRLTDRFYIYDLIGDWLIVCSAQKTEIGLIEYISDRLKSDVVVGQYIIPLDGLRITSTIDGVGFKLVLMWSSDVNSIFVRSPGNEILARKTGLQLEVRGHPSYANNEALIRADLILSAIQVYFPIFGEFTSQLPWYPSGMACIPAGSVVSKNGMWSGRHPTFASASTCSDLTTEQLRSMYGQGLRIATDLILKSERNDFEQSVVNAIYAFGRSRRSYDTSDKVLYALLALESLYARKGEASISSSLADRIALSLSNDFDSRRTYVKVIKEAYNMRSKYVHENNLVKHDFQLEYTFALFRNALLYAISVSKEFQTTTEFVTHCEERKYR